MKTLIVATSLALLLACGALAQSDSQAANGIETLGGVKSTIQAQEQALPEHQHGSMQHMEMRKPEDIASHVIGVQEPENPNRQTGSNDPILDLLEPAKMMPTISLQELEAIALKNNPTLKQAEALTRISAGLARQAGLWPNPSVGYEGSEIRGGSFNGGEQGGFVQQNIVLGGKLGLRRRAYEQQRSVHEVGTEEQKLQVKGAVQMYFYSALAQLRRVVLHRELLGIAMDAATTAHQLANVGQADAPDVLQAEVETEQAKLEFLQSEQQYIRAFRQLVAVAGEPQRPLAFLEGDLEAQPILNADTYLQSLLSNSPSLKRAERELTQAQAEVARDKRESVPDLTLRAGGQQNREINELTMQPVGAQGLATASIQIPLFNRNQGNVEASQAKVENAQREVERIRLQLMQTAQPLLQQYLTSRLEAEWYAKQLIPRAQRAYELYLGKYRTMAAAYPQVLVSQRTLFQLKDSYVQVLGDVWTTSAQLENYLLANGLNAPQASGSISTQINLPTSNGGGGTD